MNAHTYGPPVEHPIHVEAAGVTLAAPGLSAPVLLADPGGR